jgi:hypothetical protein
MSYLSLTPKNGGHIVQPPTLSNAQLMDSNQKWVAHAFRTMGAITLIKVRCLITAAGGTQANRKLTAYIYSDSNGAPGSILASIEATNFGAGVLSFLNFSQAIGSNTQFWVVFVNTATAPGTETVRIGVSSFFIFAQSRVINSSKSQDTSASTTNGGTSWTISGTSFLVCDYTDSDGCVNGYPFASITHNLTKIYGTNYGGVEFTQKEGAAEYCRQVSFRISNTGNPTGLCGLKVFIGANTYTSDTTYALANCPSGTIATFKFSAPFLMPPSGLVRMALFDSASDSSSNCWGFTSYTIQTDSDAIGTLQYAGSAKLCTSSDSGANWSTSQYEWVHFSFAFDSVTPVKVPVFPAASKTLPIANGGPATYGYDGEIGPGTASIEDFPGEYAAKEATRNAAAALGSGSTIPGQTWLVRGTTYNGTADIPDRANVRDNDTVLGQTGLFVAEVWEAFRNTILAAVNLKKGYTVLNRGQEIEGTMPSAQVSPKRNHLTPRTRRGL